MMRRGYQAHSSDFSLHHLGELAPGQQDFPAAPLAFQPHIRPQPQDFPYLAAAGMGLFHLHPVTFDVSKFFHFLIFLSFICEVIDLKISLLQMHTGLGQPEENIAAFRRMAEPALHEKPDVLVLPEMWNIGFFPRPVEDYADRDGEKTCALLSGFARENAVNIVGGSVARLDSATGKIYNTCYVFDRTGQEIAAYDKVHLFSPGKENQVFAGGQKLCTFALEGHKCGLAICYDLRFGNFLSQISQDIEILFLPAAWPKLRQEHWDVLTRARAIEYQVFVAACNGAAKPEDKHPLGGHSAVYDPRGEALAKAGENEGIISSELDFSLIDDARRNIPVRIDERQHVNMI